MIQFGREITGNFASASSREWLVTNGLGGWASGTVSGANTRRYHGLFVPALHPPLGRTVLLAKLNDRASVAGQSFALSSNEYRDGTIDPHGYRHIESFRLDWGVPTWTYALADALLDKRIWMPHLSNSVYIAYSLRRATGPVDLDVLAMVTARDAHMETHGDWTPAWSLVRGGVAVTPPDGGFRLLASGGDFEPAGVWHHSILHRIETQRGLPDLEDHFALGRFHASLQPGDTWVMAATLEETAAWDWEASIAAEQSRIQALITSAGLSAEPAWIQQLAIAADQFLVRRGHGQTVIAGYHWFGDWGRDTMIALPGLALATRRYDLARDVLETFSRFISQGMLPNRFPDAGEQPEYNTVDATLWYFHAIDRYVAASGDVAFARGLLPALADIIDWHVRGTRYNIHVDPADGLLAAGEAGVQLTWMDAKVGDWVVTPRIGKPVEINALWVNALRVMARLSVTLGTGTLTPYAQMADRAARSFERFWNASGGYLYDVLDGPDGNDPSLRPNQLLAVSLPYAPLSRDRARAVVTVCAQHLVTSFGLRSLSPRDPAFIGSYAGDQRQRDAAYHQGTVWAWLIGPFVDAYLKAFGNTPENQKTARSFLAAFETHLADDGLGTIAEIFEGAPPFAPRGCLAQAWSVGEVLRAWLDSGPVA